ncbi:MAG: hypothetical protein A2539_07130 [Elusimicrobia bacterium RIFOXYD2_FULL_34_15]|nr:MAG: hypothetical protein A2539_07130 [Elusimicrobia bacterium RIFOXYD2_FULL_34_15]
MKLGIVVYSGNSEAVWDAFRLAYFAVKSGDSVKMCLLGKGLDPEFINNKKFNSLEKMHMFTDNYEKDYSYNTYQDEPEAIVPDMEHTSTMKDLHEIMEESDKVVTF